MSVKKATQSDVQALKKLFSGTSAAVYGPDDKGYAATLNLWSKAAEKPAGVSVLPTTDEEVSVAVRYATENNLDLAVKGGGHSTAGTSSTNGGLLINQGKMRNVRVDKDRRLILAQGGATWGDIDQAAIRHGLATVGGTVADTGVGGLTLGGGYGHLSGQYGLTIDNMVGATVVLANGDIVKTNENEHPDLFWALRGAGQNFGVVTEFTLIGHPQGDVLGGMLVFPPEPQVIERLIAALNDLYTIRDGPDGRETKVKGKAAAVVGFAKPPPAGGQTMLLMLMSYFGPEEEFKQVFKPVLDCGPIDNTIGIMPYPKINDMLPVPPGMRVSQKGAAYVLPLRADFVKKTMRSFDEFAAGIPDAAGSFVVFEFYDAVKVSQYGNGSFANRGTHLNGLIMPMWNDEANDQVCRQWARDVSSLFKKELEAHGEEPSKGVDGGVGKRGHKGAVMLYGNYDQYDEISKDIFGSNYERLQQIKAKYDPKNSFNKLFAITPAFRT